MNEYAVYSPISMVILGGVLLEIMVCVFSIFYSDCRYSETLHKRSVDKSENLLEAHPDYFLSLFATAASHCHVTPLTGEESCDLQIVISQ